MRRDLLVLLRDKLRTVPGGRFDIDHWFKNDVVEDTVHPCGFAGCAVGWATTIPEFNAAGLVRTDAGLMRYVTAGGTFSGFDAAGLVFDFPSKKMAYHLFDGDSYDREYDDHTRRYSAVPPDMVADRIDQFLRDHPEPAAAGSAPGAGPDPPPGDRAGNAV